ncbi:NAD-dependent epimerase/dehydratase family protein [Labilibacter marinus]|uniref:NAD-dependent epimerase/dehydratase family protein n=1 Tax=Labilibacter marinus TaxID=1477105 RepID=UPI00094FFC8E|nr:NAD(P)-dependent oxidoreductase [Labilibacter marinus]
MKVCLLFGGCGYIGSKIIERLLDKELFEKIIQIDIKDPTIIFKDVEYINADVRESLLDIKLPLNIDKGGSWIFNLAAIHREPGHEQKEYFDTNINGAKNVIRFAEAKGLKNIFFTSSIAPYGRSIEPRTEESMLYSETPYGISKGYAELIHELWQKNDEENRLVICRPCVIYGPGDPGNVLRMIRGIKAGTFFFPGSSDIIKGYGYVYGLIDSIEFTCFEKENSIILYNYAENPVLPMKELGLIIRKIFNIKRGIPSIPIPFLVFLAFIIQIVGKPLGKFASVHPVRVKKAGFPTNIKPEFLIKNGFKFKYGFEESLKHWMSIAPEDFK